MSRIQVLSDLHLEIERSLQPDVLYQFPIPVRADLLALLGDIGWTRDERLFQWLKEQLTKFKIVFFVAGNHEPYRSSLKDSRERLERFAAEIELERSDQSSCSSQIGRFIILDKTRFDISDTITILGCTLWAHAMLEQQTRAERCRPCGAARETSKR
ncbi:hypothetical protein AX17_002417 [Amanita inopinata Kibby_2008]|nr:hypothetical protein AX17_002417 [Amanita inopinata Kibby_2008]